MQYLNKLKAALNMKRKRVSSQSAASKPKPEPGRGGSITGQSTSARMCLDQLITLIAGEGGWWGRQATMVLIADLTEIAANEMTTCCSPADSQNIDSPWPFVYSASLLIDIRVRIKCFPNLLGFFFFQCIIRLFQL